MHSSAIEHTVCLTPAQTRGLKEIGARNNCASTQEALRLAVDRLIEPYTPERDEDWGKGLPGPGDLL